MTTTCPPASPSNGWLADGFRWQRRGLAPARITANRAQPPPAAAPGLRPRRGSQLTSASTAGWPAAPGLRPRRGSQPRSVRPARQGSPAAAPGLRPRRGSQQPRLSARRIDLRRQRRDFGPGEDHNTVYGAAARDQCRGQRRGFGPGEDHNSTLRSAAQSEARSAGASAPARITTPSGAAVRQDRPGSAGTSAPARITTCGSEGLPATVTGSAAHDLTREERLRGRGTAQRLDGDPRELIGQCRERETHPAGRFFRPGCGAALARKGHPGSVR